MSRARQRGVALVIALLVVALATVLIAGLVDRGELSAARTRNVLRAEQADAYARGLEAYAAKVLARDADQNNIDAAGDLWTMPLPPTPVPGGTLSATMRDMNGCFNLNNLQPGGGNTAQPAWVERFRNLLTALRLDPTLAEVVVDWVDDNGEPGGGTNGNGAEDAAYGAIDPPYRAANRTFAHASELRLLQGFTAAVYEKLAPHVCALPPGSLLNLNTATPAVLRSIDPRITEEVALRLWNEGQAHWMLVDDLFAELNRQNIPFDGALIQAKRVGLETESRYFLARGDIELDGLPFHPTSLIERYNGIRVLQRTRGSD